MERGLVRLGRNAVGYVVRRVEREPRIFHLERRMGKDQRDKEQPRSLRRISEPLLGRADACFVEIEDRSVGGVVIAAAHEHRVPLRAVLGERRAGEAVPRPDEPAADVRRCLSHARGEHVTSPTGKAHVVPRVLGQAEQVGLPRFEQVGQRPMPMDMWVPPRHHRHTRGTADRMLHERVLESPSSATPIRRTRGCVPSCDPERKGRVHQHAVGPP